MKLILSFITLALLAVSPARGESVDSLKICMQAGDSCMREFNTFEALKYFRQAYKMVDNRDVRLKLADCYYKRANYGRAAELLKNELLVIRNKVTSILISIGQLNWWNVIQWMARLWQG